MIILTAAGKNRRFGGIPKFLLPVTEDHSLLTRHIDQVKRNTDQVIVIPTTPELYPFLSNLLKEKDCVVVKSDPISMPSSVIDAIESYVDDEYTVIMADTLFKSSAYSQMFAPFSEELRVGLWDCPDYLRGKVGQVFIDDNEKIKIADKLDIPGYDYMWGTLKFKRSFIDKIKREDPHMGYAIVRSRSTSWDIFEGNFYDCGSFDQYFRILRNIDEAI